MRSLHNHPHMDSCIQFLPLAHTAHAVPCMDLSHIQLKTGEIRWKFSWLFKGLARFNDNF